MGDAGGWMAAAFAVVAFAAGMDIGELVSGLSPEDSARNGLLASLSSAQEQNLVFQSPPEAATGAALQIGFIAAVIAVFAVLIVGNRKKGNRKKPISEVKGAEK